MQTGKRLKYARERLGLTSAQVEQSCGITASLLSDYESGKHTPRSSQLCRLADLYHRSPAFFYDQGEIGAETVLWLHPPNDVSVPMVEADFLRLCRQYRNLETWCDACTPRDMPGTEASRDDFQLRDAQRLAEHVRDGLHDMGLSGESLPGALEAAYGLKLFHLDLAVDTSAACSFESDIGVAILLNRSRSQSQRIIDLACALFHVLTWQVFRGDQTGTIIADENEQQLAACFANHLLKLTDVNPAAPGKREDPRTSDKPPVRPARFEALAIRALRQGQYTMGQFATYMGIDRYQALQLADL